MKTNFLRMLRSKIRKAEKGFTITEMLMVTALGSMIWIGNFGVLQVGTTQANVAGAKLSIEDTVRVSTNMMMQEIREAAPSSITVTTNMIAFNKVAGVDADGDIIWGDEVRYATLNNSLIRMEVNYGPSGSTITDNKVLGTGVKDIVFSANSAANPTLITFVMTTERETTQGHTIQAQLTGQAKVRNE